MSEAPASGPGFDYTSILPFDKLCELLSREEIHASWTYFEQNYHFVQSILYYSGKNGLPAQFMQLLVKFILDATDSKVRYNRLPTDKCVQILDSLYPAKNPSSEVLLMMIKAIPSMKLMALKLAFCRAIGRLLICRQHERHVDSDMVGSGDADHSESDFLQVCETVFHYCTEYAFVLGRRILEIMLNWLGILMTPSVLRIKKKYFLERLDLCKMKLYAYPIDNSLLFTEKALEDVTEIIELRNPFLHYSKIQDIEKWLLTHKKHQRYSNNLTFKVKNVSLSRSTVSVDDDDEPFYYPVFFPPPVATELGLLLRYYAPELNLPVYHVLNKTHTDHDIALLITNLEKTKTVFFSSVLDTIKASPSHQGVHELVCSIVGIPYKSHFADEDFESHVPDSEAISSGKLDSAVTEFCWMKRSFKVTQFHEIIKMLPRDRYIDFLELCLSIKWPNYDILLDEICFRRIIGVTKTMIDALLETCPEHLKIVYLDYLKTRADDEAFDYIDSLGFHTDAVNVNNFQEMLMAVPEEEENSRQIDTSDGGILADASQDAYDPILPPSLGLAFSPIARTRQPFRDVSNMSVQPETPNVERNKSYSMTDVTRMSPERSEYLEESSHLES